VTDHLWNEEEVETSRKVCCGADIADGYVGRIRNE
jgi:hypothetical protein